MMIQTATATGRVDTFDSDYVPGSTDPNGYGFGISVVDERHNRKANMLMTQDEAADLLASLLAMGVRVNKQALRALDGYGIGLNV